MKKVKYKRAILSSPNTDDLIVIPLDNTIEIGNNFVGNLIDIRIGGDFEGKALFLTSRYNWRIVKDIHNALCLIPLIRDDERDPE
jgi:hypothetical protein